MMDPVRAAVTAAVEAHLEKLDLAPATNAQGCLCDDIQRVYTLKGDFSIPAIAEVAIAATLKAIRDPGRAIFERHTNAARNVEFIHRHVINDMLAQLGAQPDLETERTEALEGK